MSEGPSSFAKEKFVSRPRPDCAACPASLLDPYLAHAPHVLLQGGSTYTGVLQGLVSSVPAKLPRHAHRQCCRIPWACWLRLWICQELRCIMIHAPEASPLQFAAT